MLRQEINLYSQIKLDHIPTRWLSWKFLWLSNIFFVCFFTIIYLSSLWNIYYLEKKAAQLFVERDELKQKFYTLKNTLPKIFFTQDVNQAINQLKENITTEQTLLKNIANYIPFSENLTSLTKIIVPGVWLTDISIKNGGEIMLLKGFSTHSTNLQLFLDKISKDKIFRGYILHANHISNEDKHNKESLMFSITMTRKPK